MFKYYKSDLIWGILFVIVLTVVVSLYSVTFSNSVVVESGEVEDVPTVSVSTYGIDDYITQYITEPGIDEPTLGAILPQLAPSLPEIPFGLNEIECLALNIYHEARGDNYAGKTAVTDVVLNRVNDARYPNSICGVVYQSKLNQYGAPVINGCQFSWYCDGQSDVPTQSSTAYQEAENIAVQVLRTGHMRGITEGSTHYHAFYVNPYWANSNGMSAIGRIGDHMFYRQH